MKNEDMPSMPFGWLNFDSMGNQVVSEQFMGLTKREQFAMAAMQGILSNRYVSDFAGSKGDTMHGGIARQAVAYADALLKELEK